MPVATAAGSMPPGAAFPPGMAVTGHNLRNDLATGEIVAAFEAEGVDCILLKGPALARLLYTSTSERPYSDIDLLVDPDGWTKAGVILTRLGFVGGDPAPGIPHDRAPYGRDWTRIADGTNVDLHEGLSETTADRREAWAYLWARREEMDLRGQRVWVLDAARRAMLVAVHAAHHRGTVSKTLEDLRRAVARIPEQSWREAAAAAKVLGCEAPFGEGLRMVDEGGKLADRLSVTNDPWLVGLLLDSGEYDTSLAVALGFERLSQIRGLRGKVVFVFRKLIPPRRYMEGWMEAHSARGGIVAAYVYRLARLGGDLASGIRRWWRVRRHRKPRRGAVGNDGS